MTSAGPELEADFAAYYRREMRWAAVALFLLVGINYLIAPLYRQALLGIPESVPAAIWLLEYGVIVFLCFALAWVRWRWSERALARWLTLGATCGIAAAIVASRYIWVKLGVPFFNELAGYFMVAAMVMLGIEFRYLCWVAVPVLVANSAVSYALYGNGPVTNFDIVSDITAATIAAFSGWFAEKNMRRVWSETSALERLARHDALTALLNRRGFETRAQDTLRQAGAEGRPLAVAVVDLDHFKPFNDRYGHPAGDDALRAVARVLAQHARQPLDLVARVGGEEFVILWFDTDAVRLAQRGRELVDAVRKLGIAHASAEGTAHLTISLGGVSGIASQAPRVGRWIEEADQLLYRAKQEGRDRAVFATL